MLLERMTWNKAGSWIGQDILAVLPAGSIEQHGPVCPLGTDYVLAAEMAKDIEKRNPESVLLLPPVPFGVCGYHIDFAGTLDVGVDAFYAYVSGIAKSLLRHGVRRFLFVNGHGGNGPSLDRIALNIAEAGGLAVIYEWWTVLWQIAPEILPGRWGHGDEAELSLMLHARPGCADSAANLESDVIHLSDTLRSDYVGNVSFRGVSMRLPRHVCDIVKNGYCPGSGDRVAVSEELGRRMYEKADDYINDFVVEFLKVPLKG